LIEAFNLPDIEKIVFLSSFDRRLKISVDIFKQLLEDPLLKEFVSPVVVRYSTERSLRPPADMPTNADRSLSLVIARYRSSSLICVHINQGVCTVIMNRKQEP
jgi:hypothetical protein